MTSGSPSEDGVGVGGGRGRLLGVSAGPGRLGRLLGQRARPVYVLGVHARRAAADALRQRAGLALLAARALHHPTALQAVRRVQGPPAAAPLPGRPRERHPWQRRTLPARSRGLKSGHTHVG